jgi:hypothetical protein
MAEGLGRSPCKVLNYIYEKVFGLILACRDNLVSETTVFDTPIYVPRCIKKPSR